GISSSADRVVVDVDGEAGNKALWAAGHILPSTVSARTGRGTHHFFRTTQAIPPKVAILPEVDLRGPGSYVVAPPSIHVNGKSYEWIVPPEENSIAEAPAWIYSARKGNGNGGATLTISQAN